MLADMPADGIIQFFFVLTQGAVDIIAEYIPALGILFLQQEAIGDMHDLAGIRLVQQIRKLRICNGINVRNFFHLARHMVKGFGYLPQE